MCKLVEDYAKEYAKEQVELGKLEQAVEIVKNMLKKNVPIETALECAQIDKATFEKYSKREQ